MAIDRDNFAERYARVAALLGESRNLRVRARSVRQETFSFPGISSFGEDGAGELYAVTLGGRVYKLTVG